MEENELAPQSSFLPLPLPFATSKYSSTSFFFFFVPRSCYAIAMVSEGNKIWNGLITPSVTDDGRTLYKLFVKQKFSSLPELIEYYYQHPVTTSQSGRKLCLARPS